MTSINIQENAQGEIAVTMAGVPAFVFPKGTVIDLDAPLVPDERPAQAEWGLMAPSLRWMNDARNVFLFERQPTTLTINYTAARKEDLEAGARGEGRVAERFFRLALPWTEYIIAINPLGQITLAYVFARPGPITSLGDLCYYLPLTNLYEDGKICMTGNAPPGADPGKAFETVFTSLWSGSFNDDLQERCTKMLQTRRPAQLIAKLQQMWPDEFYTPERIYSAWEEFEVADVLEWNYDQAHTVNDLVRYVEQQNGRNGRGPNNWNRQKVLENVYNRLYAKASAMGLF